MINFDDDPDAARWNRKGFGLINAAVALHVAGRFLVVFVLVAAACWGVATFTL